MGRESTPAKSVSSDNCDILHESISGEGDSRMPQVTVHILDHTHSKKTQVELPDGIEMSRLVPALVSRMGLPSTLQNGSPITYRLDHRRTGRRLDDDETLAGVGVENGDILSLLPELTAGGSSEKLPPPEQLNAIDDVLDSIADLQQKSLTREEIDKKLTAVLDRVADDAAKKYTELLGQIRSELSVQDKIRLNAPVEVPTPDQMRVKLVPSHLLAWLEETRAEENKWSSIAWAFLGACLGITINWITAETLTVTRHAVIMLVAFAIVAIAAFLSAIRYGKRAQQVRSDILSVGIGGERPAVSSQQPAPP